MVRRILLFVFAAAQFICANLSLSYRVSVDGREVPGTFSRAELERIGIVSCAAVDEIARGPSSPPAMDTRPLWSLRPASGDKTMLCDILISSAPGVARCCAVYAGETSCGVVADPGAFQDGADALPRGLVYRPVLSYVGRECDNSAVEAAVMKFT